MQTQPASPYAQAVDLTRELLVERSRRYKRLVMTLCFSIAVAIGLALALRRGAPLLGMLAMPAAVIAYFALDLASVRRWRQRLLEAWTRGDIDPAIFSSMLRKVPTLPALTVEGLLDTLPPTLSSTTPEERVSIAHAHRVLDEVSIRRLWLRAAFWMAAAAGAAGVVATGSIAWLSLWLPLLPSVALWRLLARRKVRHARALMQHRPRGATTPARERLPSLHDHLNWDGIPAYCAKTWLAGAED